MQVFECECGAALFFHNSCCLTCGRDVGFCPACRSVVTLIPAGEAIQCSQPECRATLKKCSNYAEESICNWCLAADDPDSLCESCRLTQVIPDLSLPGNKRRWAELEEAKRRLLYTLDFLGLPYADQSDALPLRFEFKGDPVGGRQWHSMAGGEQVTTGHADGVITINIREADSVEREQARVQFDEDLRTLVGHFRHEVGHYYWQRLVEKNCLEAFIATFGDHRRPTYDEAMENYYKNGPGADWQSEFVTAYASMHPWEDFAETFAVYLDMAALVDTAANTNLIEPVDLRDDLTNLVDRYHRLGVAINELNREMGLLDPAPFVFSDPVLKKLEFVHQLIQRRT